NGLFTDGLLQFFTSSRLVGFPLDGTSATNMTFDLPFDPGGIQSGDGRNYGLVARDPNSQNLTLVSGCSVNSILTDFIYNIRSDDQCGLRRHVSIVNAVTHQLVASSFYSYTNQNGAG